MIIEVFIVSGVWDYEGNVILGVYTTEEGAKAKKKEAEEEKRYDLVTVNRWEALP